jgi:hypothetical protein
MGRTCNTYRGEEGGDYATSRKVAGSSPDEVIGFVSVDLLFPAALWLWGQLSL